MSIFSRLSDIVNSNINSILARAEDPAKIIRLIIQEMEDTLVEVRSSAVRSIAERKELERRVATLKHEADEWDRKAELAVTRGRDDLAKGALSAKARVMQTLTVAEQQLATLIEALNRQNEDIGKLQAKLNDAKTRERAIVARSKSAANRMKLRTKLYDERISDAFARFEQVERALDEAEGKVEAFDLGRGGPLGKPLDQEFAEMEAETGVQEELAKLKQRLGNRIPQAAPQPATRTA
jgi:phage shock protein A